MMHIRPSSPNSSFFLDSEESAVIKIQAGFRGYRVRKQLVNLNRKYKRNGHHLHHHNNQHFQSQEMSTPLQYENFTPTKEDSRSPSNDIENRCATKIQAGVRGFLVRKKQKIATDAATKIQAGFRGFKARKETQKLKQK